MTRLVMVAMLLTQLGACGSGARQPRSSTPDNVAARVRAVDQARFRAMVQNDLKTLNALLAEDLVYVHSGGEVESKEEFLDRLRTGALRYVSIEPAEVLVRKYSDTAVVTGRSKMSVSSSGAERQFEVRYTAVYRSSADGWQLVSWQSTRIQR